MRRALNPRQIALVAHALKQPQTEYTIAGHRQAHGVTYQTARTDLLDLERRRLLKRTTIGRAFVFIAPGDLRARLAGIATERGGT